jgi:hypothetical protein
MSLHLQCVHTTRCPAQSVSSGCADEHGMCRTERPHMAAKGVHAAKAAVTQVERLIWSTVLYQEESQSCLKDPLSAS